MWLGARADGFREARELGPELLSDVARARVLVHARLQSSEPTVLVHELFERLGGTDRAGEGENEMKSRCE